MSAIWRKRKCTRRLEYLVAHGISSMVENKKVVIGSAHFIFEDEKCTVPASEQEKYDALPVEFSHLCIWRSAVSWRLLSASRTPLRPEACDDEALRALGIKRTVMLTGDSERTAAALRLRSVWTITALRCCLRTRRTSSSRNARQAIPLSCSGTASTIPALSAANVGVAISDGAAIARGLRTSPSQPRICFELVALRRIAQGLMSRINSITAS